ncbi:hypothetical protein ACIHIX_44845 [Streptomyces sp. NPDC051913]|uniref:hypothetical protein n=1 Tax=Streptomyces sp. NPDC051913 TaxID=3365676 RepID=UPI0037CD4D4F
MPGYDLVIDYELLNTLAKDTERLKEQLADSRLLGRGDFFHKDDLGGAFGAVNMFLLQWTGPFDNAKELLEALSQTYKFAAQKMFETDAKMAGDANAQALGWKHSLWDMNKKAYEDWKKLTGETILIHAWDKNGHEYLKQVRLADPDAKDAPAPPGPEPTDTDAHNDDFGDGTNNYNHTTHVTYDSEGHVTSSDTTIDDGPGGLTYHEHTDTGANGSYTTTVTHTDGSKTVVEVHGSENGSGTKNVTETDKDGKTTSTSSYTGSGVNTDNPQWTNTDPDATDVDGDGKDDKSDPNGSQHSNTGVGSTV